MNANNEIKYLKLEDIIPNRMQPRTEFDQDKLKELANSIKQYGIINPLIVRPTGNKYEIIAGERRYKASAIAGLTQVPVIVSNIDDNTSAEIAIIENIQRQDLSAIEEAKSYRKLLDMGHLTQDKLAQKMGKNQSTIANKMRLLNLCVEVQEALEHNKISERHARSLLQLKDINDQRELLEIIIREKLTVKNTENLIKEILQSKSLNLDEMKEENIIEQQLFPSNENIYGNDIVNIEKLNQEELEKENDNMNNEMNNNFNNMGLTQNNMEQPNNQVQTPTFGERFFPSLEDQETNINLNNPFDTVVPSQSMQQPMMENLVDTAQIPTPSLNPVMEPIPNIPTFVTSEPTPIMNQPIPDIQIQQPVMSTPQPSVNEPVMTPPIMEVPQMNQNEFINNNPMPSMFDNAQSFGIPTPMPEPIINPITPPTPQPMPEFNNIETIQSSFEQAPILNSMPQEIQNVEPAIQPMMETANEIPNIPEINPSNNVINAINAIKNLALSIQTIGYKLSISEDDSHQTYKITVEIEK